MHDRACETAGYSGTRHQNPFSVEQNCDGRGIFIITMTAKMTYRHRYLCHDSISENYSWPPPPLSSLPSASASPSSISHQHHHHHYHNNNNYHHPSRNINSTIVVIIHHHYHDHNYNNTANNYHYQRVWEESSWWDADQTISCLVTQSLLWVPLSHLEGRLVMRGEGLVYNMCIFHVIRSFLFRGPFFVVQSSQDWSPTNISAWSKDRTISEPAIEVQRFDIKAYPSVTNEHRERDIYIILYNIV
jgi:hypothetical protein